MDQKAKVIDLRSGKPVAANDDRLQASGEVHAQDLQQIDHDKPRQTRRIGRGIAKFLVFLVLQPLLLFRQLLNIVPLAIFLCCAAFAVAWLGMDASPQKTKILIGLGSASLGMTTLLWCLDVLLEKLQFWLLYD